MEEKDEGKAYEAVRAELTSDKKKAFYEEKLKGIDEATEMECGYWK
jgi:hypothetical protein